MATPYHPSLFLVLLSVILGATNFGFTVALSDILGHRALFGLFAFPLTLIYHITHLVIHKRNAHLWNITSASGSSTSFTINLSVSGLFPILDIIILWGLWIGAFAVYLIFAIDRNKFKYIFSSATSGLEVLLLTYVLLRASKEYLERQPENGPVLLEEDAQNLSA